MVEDASPSPIADLHEGSRPDEFVAQARAAGERIHAISAEVVECSVRRQTAVRILRDRFGWSHQQVADMLGVSRTAAQQIYEGRSSGGTRTPRSDTADSLDAPPPDPA